MRVLHILDHSLPLHSGYTFRTCAILQEQRKLGWETFHLTSPKQGAVQTLEEQVDRFHFFRTPPAEGWLIQLPIINQVGVIRSLSKRLTEIVSQVRPNILHAHSPALNGLAALNVAKRSGIPLVYELRALWEDAAVDHGTSRAGGPRYRASRALETHVLRRAGAITTICQGLQNEIIARGIPPARVTVVPNAVDIEQFSPQRSVPDVDLKQCLRLNDTWVLGFIGSFYAYEGLHLLLEALPTVLAQAMDVRVLLVGGGPQEAYLKHLVRKQGISDKVIFVGRVPHHDVGRYYSLIDVLVYPRLAMRLTELVTPLKPLEAMAQGKLLIASDVGGHRELIRDGATGVLFRAGDVADLEAKILDLLANPQQWERLKTEARRFVETERRWADSVARYRQVYETIVGKEV